MATYGTVSEFVEGNEDWTEYEERLGHFFSANENTEEAKKRLILLSACGAKTYKLIRNLATPRKPGDIPYDELVQLVANHHNPKPSVIVQRFKFHSHFRRQGQSVANFVAELRQLSEHCDFGPVLDDMLHDRLVCGINNDATQRRLLGEAPPLTFKKALEISQGMEMAANNAKDIQKGHGGAQAAVVHQVKGETVKHAKRVECFRCGGAHYANDYNSIECSTKEMCSHLKRLEEHFTTYFPDMEMSEVDWDSVNLELSPPPLGLEVEYKTLFTADSILFLQDLISTFNNAVDEALRLRVSRKAHFDLSGDLPDFLESTTHIRRDSGWRVLPVPPRLQRRHVDIGDLAPCDTERFIKALKSSAQGIQVDFDDGNCPTYYNQIKGIHNVLKVVHNQFRDVPVISQAPVLMLRPRAWNMVEHNLMVMGKEVPGPLFDFGLLMFHCGKTLFENKSGPFFYLSKVESFIEARLWNRIFVWTQQKLGLPLGCIKATVLIENVLATFEMEEILYELRDHSIGLNCGIWDYSASFVSKFGHRPAFLLPDRSKYVNMEKHFLRSYMDLLVQTCHRRGALATGGMAAVLLPQDPSSDAYKMVLAAITKRKLLEIKAGVDGFMVYDLSLIEPMQKLFKYYTKGDNQLQQLRDDVILTPKDLLSMPSGGVTLYGLKYNIAVGVLFINAWLSGKGHFFYRSQVEDSATAEISRSQVWQWIYHQTKLEDDDRVVTRRLVADLTDEALMELGTACHSVRAKQRLHTAADMFLEVVQKRDFPEFITTYLNQDHTFLSSQSCAQQNLDVNIHPPKL
ncbi:uncharacterized protein V6R79_024529 [Siganus canaliculatus]